MPIFLPRPPFIQADARPKSGKMPQKGPKKQLYNNLTAK
jgi:hypothetical protein